MFTSICGRRNQCQQQKQQPPASRRERRNEMRLIPLPRALDAENEELQERIIGYRKEVIDSRKELSHNFERINPKTGEREEDLPQLNFDSPHYMPGILASKDRQLDPNRQKQLYEDYIKEDYDEERRLLLVPKPPARPPKCEVCNVWYQDYQEHVESKGHLEVWRKNETVQQLIEEAHAMQSEFQESLRHINFDDIKKEKPLSQNTSEASSRENDDSQVLAVSDVKKEKEASMVMDIQSAKSQNVWKESRPSDIILDEIHDANNEKIRKSKKRMEPSSNSDVGNELKKIKKNQASDNRGQPQSAAPEGAEIDPNQIIAQEHLGAVQEGQRKTRSYASPLNFNPMMNKLLKSLENVKARFSNQSAKINLNFSFTSEK